MEFWRFRECVMHSTGGCAACTAVQRNGLQAFWWFVSLLQRFRIVPLLL